MKKFFAIVIMLTIAIDLASINLTLATHTATVTWAKEPSIDPTYPPHPGAANEYYWNGYTPKWINFTVKNNGPDPIKEIKIVFKKDSDGNSYFNFTQTRQKTGWYATPDEFGPNKRPTVIYFRTDDSNNYIKAGETARFDLFMTEGPKNECSYNIDVWTVDAGSQAATNYYQLFILIDNHLPTIEIIYPANGTIFKEGDTVWVNATASDTEGLHPSGIKRVELWFIYIEKTGTSPLTYIGVMKYDSIKKVYWWKTTGDKLRDEAWHKATAMAYDYAENKKESAPIMFFWFKPAVISAYTKNPCFLYGQPVGHVDSNAVVKAPTGFKPNFIVTVTFDTEKIGDNKTDAFGAFTLEFKVPKLPRKADPTDPKKTLPYKITATDGMVTYTTDFTIIPWVSFLDSNQGCVDDEVTITGTGFNKGVEIDVIYRDISLAKYIDSWAFEWGEESIKLEWKPQLDNLTLTPTINPPKTDAKGTFTFKFKIPQSYGGYHPVYAEERATKVRSGWMPNVSPAPKEPYPQATLFKVQTKIWTTPTIGLSGQYIQIYGEGLPLPKFTEKIYDCKTGKTTIQEHNYFLALNFGSNKHWIFEKGFILNNEFEYAWFNKIYLPFAYYYPTDPSNYPDPKSPVWNGKLCWQDANKEYHIGSPFLKVPAVMPGDYEIAIYQFDIKTEADTYKFKSATKFTVLKDPLHVRVSTGALYFNSENITVYVEIDLDGTATDPTAISLQLYREDKFQTSLTAKRVDTGVYTASFICPSEKGNYFIKVNATKAFEGFALSGFGVSGFIVSPTLDGFNATLTAISNDTATIKTNIGTVILNLTAIHASISSIDNGIATIHTDLGQITTDIGTVKGQIISLSGDIATIRTDVGTVKTSLDDIHARIILIDTNTASIKTDVGDIQGKVMSIQGKTVEIQTSIGSISPTLDSIKTETGLQPTSLALSLIAALSAIIAAILIFRKLYK